jgi:hypothetical protein
MSTNTVCGPQILRRKLGHLLCFKFLCASAKLSSFRLFNCHSDFGSPRIFSSAALTHKIWALFRLRSVNCNELPVEEELWLPIWLDVCVSQSSTTGKQTNGQQTNGQLITGQLITGMYTNNWSSGIRPKMTVGKY